MKYPVFPRTFTFINNIYNKKRKILSLLIKLSIVFLVILGFILSLITAKVDGYNHFSKRLLYFTTQSNLWIFIITTLSLFLPNSKTVFYAKFCFTVNILMTGIVYCVFLAPFADSSYNVWSFYSVIVHVLTPVFSIISFFIDDAYYLLKIKHAFCSLIPPLVYYTICVILCYGKVDFGHGSTFPYFFLNVYSTAGFFGVAFNEPPYFGTLYWILFFGSIMFLSAIILIKIKNKTRA